jgi:uncharacterized membrane protein
MKSNYVIRKIHQMAAHVRLWIGLAIAAIALIFTRHSTPAVQFIIIWMCFSSTILLLFWITVVSASAEEVQQIAKTQDSTRVAIFFFALFASFASLFAIILLFEGMPQIKQGGRGYHIAFTVVSVTLSWILIHTVFTFRYAHLYYTCRVEEKGIQKEKEGGLQFPSDDPPDYFDFAYFSFVIGMTFQVSDIQITSKFIRRLVLLHGLLSFVYSTVIVALSINIISGLVAR